MKLVAMMSWFDEDPNRLAECARDLISLGITDLVAVDGAYSLFPFKIAPFSHEDQHKAILESAISDDIACSLYIPIKPWKGNEVEKRQFMLDLALAQTTDDDWLIPWDADFYLDSDPVNLRPLLENISGKWGDVDICESGGASWQVRLLLRATTGMHFGTNHYRYHYPDGSHTVVGPTGEELEWGEKLPVSIRHLPNKRLPARQKQQIAYYEAREKEEVEK